MFPINHRPVDCFGKSWCSYLFVVTFPLKHVLRHDLTCRGSFRHWKQLLPLLVRDAFVSVHFYHKVSFLEFYFKSLLYMALAIYSHLCKKNTLANNSKIKTIKKHTLVAKCQSNVVQNLKFLFCIFKAYRKDVSK